MRDFIAIDSIDDPRIAHFRNLKDRDLARDGQRFIAEGEMLVRRLLASDYPTESVLILPSRLKEIAAIVPPAVPLYVADAEGMQRILGFKFHSGVMACGGRRPATNLEQTLQHLPDRATLLICPEVANTENLGGLMRIAAGLGVDAMILGERCCDPFYRQAVRVSMGAVFQLKLYQSLDLLADLARLRNEWNMELFATVLDASAEPLQQARRCKPRIALLLGNEAQGLDADVIAACDRKITIPMKLGTDSLNVAIAASVFLYHFGLNDR